jgi:protein-disulfide isomerase
VKQPLLPAVFLTSFALVSACQDAGTTVQGGNKAAPATTAGQATTAAAKAGALRLDANQVVAKWDGGKLTYGELYKQAESSFDKLRQKYLTDLHALEVQEIEKYLVQTFVKKAAAAKNQTEEQYLEALTKDAPVSDQEVQEFYDSKVRQTGQPFEAVKANIRGYIATMKSQDKIRAEFERLKKEANSEITLPPPAQDKVEFKLAGRPMKGKESAKVTIVEFSDFECPYCSRANPAIEALMKAYPGQVKVYFLHFPLSFHKQAMPAAVASVCAHQQDKFWPLHDELFANQAKLSEAFLLEAAEKIGLDLEKFKSCSKDPKSMALVQEDMKQAEGAGVEGTPSFFVNGVKFAGGIPSPEAIKPFLGGS